MGSRRRAERGDRGHRRVGDRSRPVVTIGDLGGAGDPAVFGEETGHDGEQDDEQGNQ
ncbi:MAG: hypothetical protein ACHQ8D_00555 [Candidatus Rokuibacteriota bacterium]